jgi:hypothetical protein
LSWVGLRETPSADFAPWKTGVGIPRFQWQSCCKKTTAEVLPNKQVHTSLEEGHAHCNKKKATSSGRGKWCRWRHHESEACAQQLDFVKGGFWCDDEQAESMGTDEHNSVRLPERRAEKDLSADSPMPEMEEIVVMVKRSQKLDTDSRCFFVMIRFRFVLKDDWPSSDFLFDRIRNIYSWLSK